jgi:hypothetical protein
MIEFALGTVFGATLGYAARAWLSARRRRAALRARIAGSGDRGFVPFRRADGKADLYEHTRPTVVPLQPKQPNRNDDSREINVPSRAELTLRG